MHEQLQEVRFVLTHIRGLVVKDSPNHRGALGSIPGQLYTRRYTAVPMVQLDATVFKAKHRYMLGLNIAQHC